MGNNTPVLNSCFEKNYLTTSNAYEDLKIPKSGPIKAKKQFSITTSETISINPQAIGTNRTSITEFAVNRNDSLFEGTQKSPEATSMVFSAPCSPGRYEKKEIIKRSYKTQGTNLVKQVRSRSLVSVKEEPGKNESPVKMDNFRNKGLLSGNNKNLCMRRKLCNNFEPFLIEDLRKRLYYK